MDFFSTRAARRLYSKQVCFKGYVKSLEDLEGKIALRNGRKFSNIVFKNNNLYKVSLENDFTLPTEMTIDLKKTRSLQNKNKTITSKLKKYFGKRNFFYRSFGFINGNLAHILFNKNTKNPNTDSNWALVPGINFLYIPQKGYLCIDYGGIYEDYLTSQNKRYPSQVGTDLYTSSMAAYIFFHYKNKEPFNDSYDSSYSYFLNYHNYHRQRLEFDHKEFDYAPLTLAFGENFSAKFYGWTKYDPINVYGLRLHNENLKTKNNFLRKAFIFFKLFFNQTKSGLIRDNHMGRSINSIDLTYHQFTIAELILANFHKKKNIFDKIILKGINFSVNMSLQNGEATYYGRGANNIYHLASFCCALFLSYYRYGFNKISNLSDSLDYLLSHKEVNSKFDNDMVLPTAINEHDASEMIGWHGSCLQYEAQSAFYLIQAMRLSKSSLTNHSQENIPILQLIDTKHKTYPFFNIFNSSKNIRLVICYSTENRVWNGGINETGYPGACALLINGINYLAINEKISYKNNKSILLSDLCFLNNEFISSYKYDQSYVEFLFKPSNLRIKYTSKGEGIKISIKKKLSAFEYYLWFRYKFNIRIINKFKIVIEFENIENIIITSTDEFTIRCSDAVKGSAGMCYPICLSSQKNNQDFILLSSNNNE